MIQYNIDGCIMFVPDNIPQNMVEEAKNSPNPRRALMKLADYAIENGYVVKNRYDGVVAPTEIKLSWWERLTGKKVLRC